MRALKKFYLRSSLSLLLGLGLSLTSVATLKASTPRTAPPELRTLVSKIDSAANKRDIKAVMEFYSPKFTNSDGLTYDKTRKALKSFWDRYKDLKYTTTIVSWEKTGDKLTAETLTTIQGTGTMQGRAVNINARIGSRQQFQANKLISQEILSERIELTAGDNPPKITVRIPDRVKVGQEFDFDVIVQEPLGDELLAGIALDERVNVDRYMNPRDLDLELLQAGGLFKRVKAPGTPENRWLSAILIQGDGISLVTQRVRVEK